MTPQDFLAYIKLAKASQYPIRKPASEFRRIHAEQLERLGVGVINSEAYFDDYLPRLFGGIVDVLPERHRIAVKERIAVGILNNIQVNAFIVRSDDGKCFAVLLNRALLEVIHHYVKLVAAADYPDSVIYCNGEATAKLGKADYMALLNTLLKHYVTTGQPSGPELKLDLDSTGMSFVEEALSAIHFFVLAHEIGHYINGDLAVRTHFARADNLSGASMFLGNLSHQEEYAADDVAFDVILRVLANVTPDYPARLALYMSAYLFFCLVRDICNRGSETHPRPTDRLLTVTRSFFGDKGATLMAQGMTDVGKVLEFHDQFDHLTVTDVLRSRQ
jgi:hypothetical protein